MSTTVVQARVPGQRTATSTVTSTATSTAVAPAVVAGLGDGLAGGARRDRLWAPVADFTLSGLTADEGELFASWSVARVVEDAWTVVAGTGATTSHLGVPVTWEETLCAQLQRSGDAVLVGDLRRRRDPLLRATAQTFGLRAYVGAAVLAPDGSRIGSLCGWSATPAHDDERLRARVERHATFLGTTLAREIALVRDERAADWSVPAESRDALTQLPDRRSWGRLLQREEDRGRLLAEPAVITAVDASATSSTRGLRRLGRALEEATSGTGVVARTGPRQFAVLSCATPGHDSTAAADRVRTQLADAAPQARTGRSSRAGQAQLAGVWAAAEAQLLVARRGER